MLGKQRELVMRLQALSEENRAIKERWKQASEALDEERQQKEALVDRLVPGAAAAVARCDQAERKVAALESQLQQALDGVLVANPAAGSLRAPADEARDAGGAAPDGDSLALPPALQRAMNVRSLTAFASRWSVDSLFPTMSVAWATVAAQGVVLVPILAMAAVVRAALAVPVIEVPFSVVVPGAWAAAWSPLGREALLSVWLPLLGCAGLVSAMAYAAAVPSVRRWAAVPLLVSVGSSAAAFWALSAWPVLAPLPQGAPEAPDGWQVVSARGDPLDRCPPRGRAGGPAPACLLRVPAWSSPLLLLLALSPGPLLTALRVVTAPSTRRTHAWAVRRAAGTLCRAAETAGAAVAAALTLILLASLPDPVLASSLLQHNALQHALLLLLAALGGDAAQGESVRALRDTVSDALKGSADARPRPAPAPATAAPRSPWQGAAPLTVPPPDFFGRSGSPWATLALYAAPAVILAWLAVRVALHHASERAEAAARPAGLAEHVSREGDERAATRALPPLIAYAATHAALLAWLKLVAEPSAPPGAWEAAGVGAVSAAAASSAPLLLLASASIAIVTHRLTRDVLPLNDPLGA